MQKTKKLFSVLLAVIMLATTFTFAGNAGAPDLTGTTLKTTTSYEICHADGTVATSVTPGEIVTVNVYSNSSTANDEMTKLTNSIYYDASVYTYVSDSVEYIGIANWVDPLTSTFTPYTTGATAAAYKNSSAAWTADEKAAHPGWVSFIYCTIAASPSATPYYVQENKDTPMYSVKFKVNDNVAVGSDAAIGCPASCYFIRRGQVYNMVTTNATGTITKAGITGAVGTTNVVDIKVAAAEEPFPSTSIVNPLKGQIRFNKDAEGKFTFDVRAMAVISKADFESKFAAGEAAEAEGVIKDIGFVFAAASNGVDLTYENVKKVVEGDETVEGYAKKEVKFISTTLNSPNYVFTCMVTGMDAEDYEDSLLAVAYIAYADADGNPVYCYYPAVQEVSYSGLIDTYYESTFGEKFAK